MRNDTPPDFQVPHVRDELRFVVRHGHDDRNTTRHALPVRNNPSQEALPMRSLGFPAGRIVVGGS